jgi:hypothetical protein
MSRQSMVQDCDHAFQTLFPEMPRPEQKALASLVTGVVNEQEATLARASVGMPGPAQNRSKERRAQRLLANARLDVPRAQRRLLARVLARCAGQLDVALDATTTRGTTSLVLAVCWHGRALPLLWRTWRSSEPGQDWKGAIRAMATELAAGLPDGVTVVLLADRGLTGEPLTRLAAVVKWHYLLRAQRQTEIQQPDGTVCSLAALVPKPGSRQCLTGVRIYAPRRRRSRRQRARGGGGWERAWRRGLQTNIVAVWRRREEEAWLLVTDLPATLARCTEYRRRTWEEQLFRDLKSWGWGWQRSHVSQPQRVERLLLVLALATFWVFCVAQRVLKGGHRPLLEPRSRRLYSYFQLGLRYIHRRLANDEPVPVLFHLWKESFPCPKTVG